MATQTEVKKFIERIAPIAQAKASGRIKWSLPSVCIAQCCTESAYGTSKKMINANAILGIKVGKSKVHFGRAWKDKAYSTATKECYDGKTFVNIMDMFRAYDSIDDAIVTGKNVEQSKGGIVSYSLKSDGEKQISKNFKVKEFKCKDGSGKILVDVDFVKNKLQAIHDHFGVSVTINSAYRTLSYNAKVGGAKSSYHLKGQAFDITVKGKTPLEVAKYAQILGINGIIQYNTFVHVDSRPGKYWARNNNGNVTTVKSF